MSSLPETENEPTNAVQAASWDQPEHWSFQTRASSRTPRWQPFLAVAILLIHGMGIGCLHRLMLPQRQDVSVDEIRTLIEFPALPSPSARNPADAGQAASSSDTKPGRSRAASESNFPRDAESAAYSGTKRGDPSSQAMPDAVMRRKSLRLELSEDVLRDIPDPFAENRRFDYETPGLRESARWLRSPVVLEYQATRFDENWRPTENLLDDILERAVEKTTPEIKLRIPGVKDGKLVCRVSLLALGGGCGFVPNHGFRPHVDDPNTLDDEEYRQCQAWYEQIRRATNESAWMRTRALYEAECRKPREENGLKASRSLPTTPAADLLERQDVESIKQSEQVADPHHQAS